MLFLWPSGFLVLLAAVLAMVVWRANAVPLVVRLGYPEQSKLLIVNADDGGLCEAANTAVFQALERGMVTSSTLMVPAPGFPAAAAYVATHPGLDIGIHLTHTAEWQTYRWGPILPCASVPGLVDDAGFLRHEVGGAAGVYAHSNPAEAAREAEAQMAKALSLGLDITHVDSHMGAMQYDVRYFLRFVALARRYDIPLRMPSQELLTAHHAWWLRPLARAIGLEFPDDLILDGGTPGMDTRSHWHSVLRRLKPGVTELYIHPALAGDEMRAITNSWQQRQIEFETFFEDTETRRILDEEGIILIGYRPLRDLQRGVKPQRSSGPAGHSGGG